jgi:hypothetical protein
LDFSLEPSWGTAVGNISDHLPKESKTVQAIYGHYKARGDKGHMSRTLAVSLLGRPCERFLWYSFRQCVKPEFSGRMYRLFDRGDLEEARLTADLRAIGCQVHVIDESTGKQFKVEAFGGAALKKKGLKESKPEHYAQVMIYMHRTGIRRALYLAVNKDTDEIYAERIRYDKAEAEALMEKARRVITAAEPPARIGNRPDWYECRWCDAKTICWGTNHPKDILGEISDSSALPVPSLSCRQCCHATPVLDVPGAIWFCEKKEHDVDCALSCPQHLTLPGLLSFTEPGLEYYGRDENGHEWIEFRNQDGAIWRHGNAAGCISSEELTKIPASALGDETIQAAKDLFGATITDCEQDILQRYPESDSRIVWRGPANEFVKRWREIYNEDLTALQPVGQDCNPNSHVVELPGGRVAICWIETDQGEIREGVE